MLESIAKKVTLIHLSKNFSALEDTLNKLFASKVDVGIFYELKAVHGEEKVEGATIFHNKEMTETSIPLDAIIINIGFLANLGPIKEWD